MPKRHISGLVAIPANAIIRLTLRRHTIRALLVVFLSPDQRISTGFSRFDETNAVLVFNLMALAAALPIVASESDN